MGTTRSGKFETYPSASGKSSQSWDSVKGGDSPCRELLSEIELEDVARCEFYQNKKKVPSVNTSVYLDPDPTSCFGRLCIKTSQENLTVGFLPTEYNFLIQCLQYSYRGKVIHSESHPIPKVIIDLKKES